MDTLVWNWPGARWWRCDLHTHSPASSDFTGLGALTAEDWVREAAQRLDVVAVTDHTSGRWFGELRRAAAAVAPGLTVFPGVEVNCDPGVHLVVLFDPTSPDDVVSSFLGALGIDAAVYGRADYLCQMSLPKVVEAAAERGGLCIAAHVDGPKGLLAIQPARPDGGLQFTQSLEAALNCPGLCGLEVKDPSAAVLGLVDGSNKQWAKRGRPLPRIASSDAHKPADIGVPFTWIKMSKPSIEGLRLALLDGDLSVSPRWSPGTDPNAHASYVLRGIRARNGRYVGRTKGEGEDGLVLKFSPWFTAIIGGRGTGKSTFVDLLRSALGRKGELPEALKHEFQERMSPPTGRGSKSLVTPQTEVSAQAMRANAIFRARWQPAGGGATLLHMMEGDQWRQAEGHIHERLPVRIYSQKQIFELSSDAGALLDILDAAPAVDARAWEHEWERLRTLYTTKRAQIRQLRRDLATEATLKGRLDDLVRQITVFEQDGNADLLKGWQVSQRQRAAVSTWNDAVAEALSEAQRLAEALRVKPLVAEAFDPEKPREAAALAATTRLRDLLHEIAGRAEALVREATEAIGAAQSSLAASEWAQHSDGLDARHAALVQQLKDAGATDPEGYARLVRERQQTQASLDGLAVKRQTLLAADQEANELLARLKAHRRLLSDRRQAFVDSVLAGNQQVRIRVHPYGAEGAAVASFRRLIGREDQFGRDIDDGDGSIFARLYTGYGLPRSPEPPDKRDARIAAFEAALVTEKERLVAIAAGTKPAIHNSFANFLKTLQPELWDALETWFPPDDLCVEFKGRDGKWQGVATGSPGQRTAALLSFLLSYGDEPIVLDQPEDDLDNQLVYELVVEQIRRIKGRRQIIIVTHNPNIVVNGDAECVIALAARGGQTHVDACGGLQEEKVRETICAIMEGGKDAFTKRWERIGEAL